MRKIISLICFISFVGRNNFASASRRKGLLLDQEENEGWRFRWFPGPPSQSHDSNRPHRQDVDFDKTCDGDKNLVNIDFDPADERHSFNYLCFSSKHSEYTPDMQREAVLVEHFIPPAFKPPIKCLNESIEYTENPPTFGGFRLLPPKYGTYKYLPPQRWLHSLAEGAVVMLYHPCAFPGQVKQLENIIKSCLYRHIITPTQDLTPDRPLALLVWGKYLKLSVVDEGMIINFIKKNANQGIIKENPSYLNPGASTYKAGLIEEASLITDLSDDQMCGFKEM